MRRASSIDRWTVVWLAIFVCGTAGAAFADPISFDIGQGMFAAAALVGFAIVAFLIGIPLLIVYGTAVVAVETWLVRCVLPLERWTAVRIVLVLNLVSVALGGVLSMAFEGGGWKTAWVHGEWGAVVLLWLQSLVIAIVVEFLILALILRGRSPADRALSASALANVGSYVLSAVFMLVLTWAGLFASL